MSIYQLTIEDMQHIDYVSNQPGRSAYIDECGSFGFDFSKSNTTKHYVVCAVIVDNSNVPKIESAISEMRKAYFSGTEMKSSSIGTNHKRRAKILMDLLLLDFQLIISLLLISRNFTMDLL